MNLSITEFLKQVEDIRVHNECFESLRVLLGKYRKTEVDAERIAKNYTSERTFNYRANVISLYGCFEHFVESLIKEYMDDLSKVCESFESLDKKIKSEYVDCWKTLHGKLAYPKFSYISERSMVESLYQSVVERRNKVMAECYLRNGGNYTHKVVADSFLGLGLNDFDTILDKYPPLDEYFVQEGLQGMDSENKYRLLNTLVQLRNNIAHGADSDNILSIDEFTEYLNFLERYAKAVALYINDHYWEKYWEIKAQGKTFKPDKIYSRMKVAEFTMEGVMLYRGQKVMVKRAQNSYPRHFFFTLPEKFKVKRSTEDVSKIVDVEELCEEGIWNVSIKVEEKCNEKCRFLFDD